MTTQEQVLIVGAGPVGLTLAMELARHGVRPRIIDQAAARSDKSKALVVWSRTLELLQAAGLADRFLAAGLRVGEARIFAGSRKLVAMPLGLIDSAFNFGLLLPQSETERLLEEHLTQRGVTVERSVALAGLRQEADAVIASLVQADGREEQLAASWLVGCDGAHSTTRHALGLAFAGETEDSDWILGDVRIDQGQAGEPVLTRTALNIFWHAEGVLIFFPLGEDRYRVAADVGPARGEGRRPDPSLVDIQEVMDRRGPGRWRATDPAWLSSFRINERQVDHYRIGRVFLAGDAAHIHSPAGGQGMNTGMQDAFNLAWKLALVCRGQAADGLLLASYERERRPVAATVIRAATLGTRLAIIRQPLGRILRDTLVSLVSGLPPVQRGFANRLAETAIAYHDSLLTGTTANENRAGGLARPGLRAPDVRLEAAPGEPDTLYGRLAAGHFLAVGKAAPATQARERFEARFGAVCHTCSALGETGALTLVRPDGYVAVVAAPGDWKTLDDHLLRILGRVS
ncbi:MAG: FAD-dependent monooxygenase [Solidesulfovibrio sp. DCME]|uniref:FAD-dependent monooxygenase n=1 Tax=Solidesulfovibrio sp. DCME TaxID=3447380 RepID=UPI003D12CADA